MATHWAIWLKRPGRYGKRPYPKVYGWVPRSDAKVDPFRAEYIGLPTEDRHGYASRDEAESAALVIAATYPWTLGWLEVRIFCGYRDSGGNWICTRR